MAKLSFGDLSKAATDPGSLAPKTSKRPQPGYTATQTSPKTNPFVAKGPGTGAKTLKPKYMPPATGPGPSDMLGLSKKQSAKATAKSPLGVKPKAAPAPAAKKVPWFGVKPTSGSPKATVVKTSGKSGR